MRPINLIPEEVKRRSSRQSSGPAPYVVIAFLCLAVAGGGVYVLLENQLTSKRDRLNEVTAKVDAASKQAEALSQFGKFGALKRVREAGVVTIADSRFPWDEIAFDIAKAMPSDAWLVSMTGKVSPEANTGDAKSGSGGGSTGSAGSGGKIDVPGPTLQLVGCTYSQSQLAEMMTRLRNIDGVAQVLLSSSEEKENAGSSSPAAGSGGDECRTKLRMHKFTVTLTFPPGPATQLVGTLQAGGGSASPAAGSKAAPSGASGQPVSGGAK